MSAGAARLASAALLSLAGCYLLAGCYAAPPPAAPQTELSACHPGAYSTLSEHRCASHADCLLCGTPDGCGELTSRRAVMLDNRPCPRPDRRACGEAAAYCCRGRCVRSLGPPPL